MALSSGAPPPQSSMHLHEGWLSRHRGFLRGTVKRFCVLDCNSLRQYKGVIDVNRRDQEVSKECTEIRFVRSCIRKGAKHFTLELMNLPHRKQRGGTVDFQTQTTAEADLWTLRIQTLLSSAGKGPYDDIPTDAASSSLFSDGGSSQHHSRVSQNVHRVSEFWGNVTSSDLTNINPRMHSMPPIRFIDDRAMVTRSVGSRLTNHRGSTPSQSSRPNQFAIGSRVRFGSLHRYGIIEMPHEEPGKYVVRVEGLNNVLLPIAAVLLYPADGDPTAAPSHHEPPLPQHLASELRSTLWRKEDRGKQKKVDSALRQLVVEDFTFALRGKDGDETEKECSICCMEYEEGDKRLRLPCFHVFHDDCVRPWFRDKSDVCPVCQISLVDALGALVL